MSWLTLRCSLVCRCVCPLVWAQCHAHTAAVHMQDSTNRSSVAASATLSAIIDPPLRPTSSSHWTTASATNHTDAVATTDKDNKKQAYEEHEDEEDGMSVEDRYACRRVLDSDMFSGCFNPFNGKVIEVRSVLFYHLTRLGFLRDPDNTLQLTWSAARYRRSLEAMQAKLQLQRDQQEQQQQQQQQQHKHNQACKKESTNTATATHTGAVLPLANKRRRGRTVSLTANTPDALTLITAEESSSKVSATDATAARTDTITPTAPTEHAETAARTECESVCATDTKGDAVMVVVVKRVSQEEALNKLLRPFEKSSSASWRRELASVMREEQRRGDGGVADVLRRRYAQLLMAYMPPKLCASPDASLLPTCAARVGPGADDTMQTHHNNNHNDDTNRAPMNTTNIATTTTTAITTTNTLTSNNHMYDTVHRDDNNNSDIVDADATSPTHVDATKHENRATDMHKSNHTSEVHHNHYHDGVSCHDHNHIDANTSTGARAAANDESFACLTPDQSHIVQLALSGYSLYVGGSAGTGKTTLLKCLYHKLSALHVSCTSSPSPSSCSSSSDEEDDEVSENKPDTVAAASAAHTRSLRVALTATTGVAAVQLGGRTFHHAFGVPLDPDLAHARSWDSNALRVVDVVILDEVSLLDAAMFDAFDRQARLARMSNRPFGGLQIIACGDFMQLRHISSTEAIPAAYHSMAFAALRRVKLVTQLRHRGDDALQSLLHTLRRGGFDAATFAALHRPVPAAAAHTVTYLYPCRREAQQLNEVMLDALDAPEMSFAPQHGPRQLLGRFTASAWVEWPAATTRSRPLAGRGGGGGRHGNAARMPRLGGGVDELNDSRECATAVKSEYHEPLHEGDHEQRVDKEQDECEAQQRNAWSATESAEPAGVPTRAYMLLALREALVTVCGSSDWLTEVADHDFVFMPMQTPHGYSMCVRVRLPDGVRSRRSAAAPHTRRGCAGGHDQHTTNEPRLSRRGAHDRNNDEDNDSEVGGDDEGDEEEGEYEADAAWPMPRRPRRAAWLLTAANWERVVRLWLEQMPGSPRLRGFLDSEPAELIPPSVAAVMVDSGNADVTERLTPLRLKLGCRVMVNRNLTRTVSNGSVGVVESFAPVQRSLLAQQGVRARVPVRTGSSFAMSQQADATMMNSRYRQGGFTRSCTHTMAPVVRLLTGEVVQVLPVTQILGGTPQTYFYSQELACLPLQLGYGFTVHKVQGLTLDGTVVLDCARFFTCPHLLYVACSRVRSMDQLIVRNVDATMATVDSDALSFAESLCDASDARVLEHAKGTPRAAWVEHVVHE